MIHDDAMRLNMFSVHNSPLMNMDADVAVNVSRTRTTTMLAMEYFFIFFSQFFHSISRKNRQRTAYTKWFNEIVKHMSFLFSFSCVAFIAFAHPCVTYTTSVCVCTTDSMSASLLDSVPPSRQDKISNLDNIIDGISQHACYSQKSQRQRRSGDGRGEEKSNWARLMR